MSAVADKLDEARALIERGWTQGYVGRDTAGEPVDFNDFDTVPVASYCAQGAILKVCAGSRNHWAALDSVEAALRINDLGTWNDAPGRTQAEVIDAFKRAAELARAGEL